VNFNDEGKNFGGRFQPPAFKKSPQEGGQGGHSFQPQAGFAPSFGGSGFPTSVGYNTESQSDDTAGFYDINDDDGPPSRGRPEFEFPAPGFGQDKDGRGGVSQVSILPLFYNQLFSTKVFCAAFMSLQFGFVIVWRKVFAQNLLIKCW
jgi:hypothetical protein